MVVKQVFFNGSRLDATSALLEPEPTKRTILQNEREHIQSAYDKIKDLRWEAEIHANDAARAGNSALQANWEGMAKAFKMSLKLFEDRFTFIRRR